MLAVLAFDEYRLPESVWICLVNFNRVGHEAIRQALSCGLDLDVGVVDSQLVSENRPRTVIDFELRECASQFPQVWYPCPNSSVRCDPGARAHTRSEH